jgi:hypothetical protein
MCRNLPLVTLLVNKTTKVTNYDTHTMFGTDAQSWQLCNWTFVTQPDSRLHNQASITCRDWISITEYNYIIMCTNY